MQVTETLAEGLKHEFQISVPASDLDAKADARLVDLKDRVRLNGFRPGKVPVSHLKKVYGRSVMAETIDQTIRDTNSQIFTERGFRLATEPRITMPTEKKAVEDILTGKSDLTYTVSIEVVPPIRWKRTFLLRRALLRGTISVVHPAFGPRQIVKSVIAVPVYAAALPFAFVLGHHRFMTLLVKLADHLGKLLSLLGINPIRESYVTE